MTPQTCGTTKYKVCIGEEKGRFDPYRLEGLMTKAEFEAEFAEAGNKDCDFAWTSDTTAEWYSWDVMSQEDGSEAKEWIPYWAELEAVATTTNPYSMASPTSLRTYHPVAPGVAAANGTKSPRASVLSVKGQRP